MKAIAILNRKGGVAKTVTAVNMAAILAADYKKRVLLVDCDSQLDATNFFGGNEEGYQTTADILQGLADPCPENLGMDTAVEHLRLIPGDLGLMSLDLTALENGAAKNMALRDLCDAVREDGLYDYILFDCPPAFSASSTAALAAADEVIIPIKLDAFSIDGMAFLTTQINLMRRVNPKLHIAGCLITMWYRDGDILAAERELRTVRGAPHVFETVIRRTPKVDKMTFEGEPIIEYSPRSAAARDYRAFVAEYLKGGAGNG